MRAENKRLTIAQFPLFGGPWVWNRARYLTHSIPIPLIDTERYMFSFCLPCRKGPDHRSSWVYVTDGPVQQQVEHTSIHLQCQLISKTGD